MVLFTKLKELLWIGKLIQENGVLDLMLFRKKKLIKEGKEVKKEQEKKKEESSSSSDSDEKQKKKEKEKEKKRK